MYNFLEYKNNIIDDDDNKFDNEMDNELSFDEELCKNQINQMINKDKQQTRIHRGSRLPSGHFHVKIEKNIVMINNKIE